MLEPVRFCDFYLHVLLNEFLTKPVSMEPITEFNARVGPPKSREAPALCGWQDFFGLTFFVTFLCQDKKVRIEGNGFIFGYSHLMIHKSSPFRV